MNPKIEITLDKKRHLLFDLNAMCSFEEVTGKNLFESDVFEKILKNMDPINLRALLWACLLEEDPELSLKDAGKLLHGVSLEKVATAINAAIMVAVPEGKQGAPLASRLRGLISGLLGGITFNYQKRNSGT
jgi:hypothetical protein